MGPAIHKKFEYLRGSTLSGPKTDRRSVVMTAEVQAEDQAETIVRFGIFLHLSDSSLQCNLLRRWGFCAAVVACVGEEHFHLRKDLIRGSARSVLSNRDV